MDAAYWNQRYKTLETGWDIGYANPALMQYLSSSELSKDSKILIAGGGKAYEAEALHHLGYTQVFVVDLAQQAKEEFLQRVPDFPAKHYIIGDFFELDMQFDLALEQTFFCAIEPSLRPTYVKQMAKVLEPAGLLAGVLFNMEKADGPPFGGNKAEYLGLFSPHFEILTLEPCFNSIPPRAGNEFFIEFKQKKAS